VGGPRFTASLGQEIDDFDLPPLLAEPNREPAA
jgi:hypothetical protein